MSMGVGVVEFWHELISWWAGFMYAELAPMDGKEV